MGSVEEPSFKYQATDQGKYIPELGTLTTATRPSSRESLFVQLKEEKQGCASKPVQNYLQHSYMEDIWVYTQ